VPPDDAALDALVARAVTTDGRWAWAEPEPVAARAVAIGRLLPLIDPTDGYVALAAPEELLAFTRTAIDGTSRLVTIVPRAVERPAGLVVDLPPGTWRHVLLDGFPAVDGAFEVDEALDAFPAIVLVTG
jgi:hypothetical protein